MAQVAGKTNGAQRVSAPERVLGIDPGLNVTGYAVLEAAARGPVVVEAGVIRPRAKSGALAQRLLWIHRGVVEVLEAFPAGSLALERVHSHVRYPRTAILMAHARGVIMLAAAQHQTPVFGYAATRIKKTLTGNGRAPKEQMQHAIMTELSLEGLPEPHDVADACAIALCHFHTSRGHHQRPQE
jgi:crossover junction endodeoxyribonuclease RuvC